ncbi:MAG: enoyl-CoA hydratase/isomerase family protein [Bacteroidetes bacterium]|nr:enoyl-CoA hydratase/isomerase family protein [Bacteroidota bacterium]MBL6944677.1 enoyl-CoA hydratase/isomerase family protein [Bacteroidales bacterium]
MEKVRIEYTHNNSVASIILDDGKGNVLDNIMMNELIELFDDFSKNENLKIITFEGAGKHFSFGASVEEHTKDKVVEMLSVFHSLFYNIINLSIPTLAKISGQCLGGGNELALICNFLFADSTAFLGQPEIILGVFAPPASVILPLKIGNARAEELLITGKIIPAAKAFDIGLINGIFEDRETLNKGVDEWIEKNILTKSAISLRYAVKASRVMFNQVVTEKLAELERIFLVELMETHDANEGINSFMEKRKPIWTNK